MSSQTTRLVAAVLFFALTPIARAAETAPTVTPAEKSYLELRNSKDTKNQLLAQRWHGLVQRQEWADATGKFQSTAEYLEQDEKQGTVKLRVFKGSGKDQVVTDRTISVDKLSKECQARVKQIGFLAAKVDEAEKADAEKAAAAKDGQGSMGGMSGPAGERSAPGDRMPGTNKSARPEGKDRSKKTAAEKEHEEHAATDASGLQRGPQGAESAALPAAPPSLPVVAATEAESRSAAMHEPSASSTDGAATTRAPKADASAEPHSVQPANLPDQKPWRTSFDSFRGNLTATRTGDGWQLGWGELAELESAMAIANDPRAHSVPGAAPSFDYVGEVAWEVPLSQQPDENTDWSKALGLKLPEPFKIICKLDEERGPGDWHRFFPGDSVNFIGRFVGFEGEGGIQMAIRFPDSVPMPVPRHARPAAN
ncbi:MAG TPA: hypothetical protein VGI40_15350 [Pirellulaceae bacterium]